jgi:hypothetical protein
MAYRADLRDGGTNLLVVPDGLAVHDVASCGEAHIADDDAASGEEAGGAPGDVDGELAASLEVLIDRGLDQVDDLLGNARDGGGYGALVGGAGNGTARLGNDSLAGSVESSVLLGRCKYDEW